jgi:hypothetical protein
MKTTNALTLLLLALLLVAPGAQAYYNPSTGRWLSRDPLHEKAFADSHARGARAAHGWDKHAYAFIQNQPVSTWDVLGLKTAAEYLWCADRPCCCWNARKSGDEVTALMERKYPGTGNTDDIMENAIKHCTWMCYVVSLWSCTIQDAQMLGWAHEAEFATNPKQHFMDLWNNEIGLHMGGRSLDDCFNKCKSVAAGGKGHPLIWMDKPGGGVLY